MQRVYKYLFFIVAIATFSACKKDFDGSEKANRLPDTFVVTDTIVRSGDDRFASQVKIQWWGTDADGYVEGYEYRINDSAWQYTKKQDSTFLLIIPTTSDTFDFKFEVRAIDNKGERDETPARLFYPVKNTAPTVSFYEPTAVPSRNPVRSFPALRFLWRADDLDGIASLDSFEICWNDTTGAKVKIPPAIRDVLLVGTNLSGASTSCQIYLGNSQNAWGQTINGLLLNDTNVLYIRAIDKVGATSPFAVTGNVYVRKPQSDILVVNAIESQFLRANIQNFYTTSLNSVLTKSYDIMQATERVANNYTELSPDPFTQAQVFKFFKRIFWFSDNTDFSLGLLQKSSGLFVADGGRMMVICAANDNLPATPAYLDFTPIKNYLPVSSKDAFLMQQNDSIVPTQAGWPILTTPNFLTGIRPFELPLDNGDFKYEVLYNGLITNEKNSVISRWQGISTLVSKRIRRSDNKTDFIICTVPLHQFNGLSNIDSFISQTVITELEF